MRIFQVLHPSSNLSVPGSMTWYRNLYEPLIDIGHEVVLCRMDEVANRFNIKFRSAKFREVFSEVMLTQFRAEHSRKPFNLFLSYITDNDVETSVLQQVKTTGIPMANFSCNNTHQFYLVRNISPLFDFNLHSEKDVHNKFREIGANPVWFPMAANPKYYFPTKCNKKYEVSFIGAAYAKRPQYIHHLVSNGILVECFGPNWLTNKPYEELKRIKKEIHRLNRLIVSLICFSPGTRLKMSSELYNYDLLNYLRSLNKDRMHYPCSDEDRIKIINLSKINLGFLEVNSEVNHNIIQQHIHLREFEIPMCGGLYITNHSSELGELFEIDKEVITYKNEHELMDKVVYYLRNEVKANFIRRAAYKRATECHTYQRRFKELFTKLKLI